MTIQDFLKSFYEENSQSENIKMEGGTIKITENPKLSYVDIGVLIDSKSVIFIPSNKRNNIKEIIDLKTEPKSFLSRSIKFKGDYILNNQVIGHVSYVNPSLISFL